MNTITDDYVHDLVRDAGLDWHQGFDLEGDNRYARLIWNTIALEEKRRAAKVAELEADLSAMRVEKNAQKERVKGLEAQLDMCRTMLRVYQDSETSALTLEAAQPAQVAAPTQADGWQPIETVPKDKQLCAVHAPGAMVCDVWPARWNAECGNFEAGGGWFEPDEVVSWIALPKPAPKREGGSDATR